MAGKEEERCPHCGQKMPGASGAAERAEGSAAANGAERSDGETDRRGVLLPARQRVGGIITPQ